MSYINPLQTAPARYTDIEPSKNLSPIYTNKNSNQQTFLSDDITLSIEEENFEQNMEEGNKTIKILFTILTLGGLFGLGFLVYHFYLY